MLKRKALSPSLNKAVQAGALGATKKCMEKHKEILNDYLSHLLSKRNLLNRCPELLRFVGAYDPLPESVRIQAGVMPDLSDGLGRFELSKSHLIQGTKILNRLLQAKYWNVLPKIKMTMVGDLSTRIICQGGIVSIEEKRMANRNQRNK